MSEVEHADGKGEPGEADGGRAQASEANEEGLVEGVGDGVQLLGGELRFLLVARTGREKARQGAQVDMHFVRYEIERNLFSPFSGN